MQKFQTGCILALIVGSFDVLCNILALLAFSCNNKGLVVKLGGCKGCVMCGQLACTIVAAYFSWNQIASDCRAKSKSFLASMLFIYSIASITLLGFFCCYFCIAVCKESSDYEGGEDEDTK